MGTSTTAPKRSPDGSGRVNNSQLSASLPRFLSVVTVLLTLQFASSARADESLWTELSAANLRLATGNTDLQLPEYHRAFRVDAQGLSTKLARANNASGSSIQISLPHPEGGFETFQLHRSGVLSPALAAQFPEIRAYKGRSTSNPHTTVQLELSPRGLTAQILNPGGRWMVDPIEIGKPDLAMSYYARHTPIHDRGWKCDLHPETPTKTVTEARDSITALSHPLQPRAIGQSLRTYRLAIAATGEYSQYHGGTTNSVMAAITTTIARVTGIYEKELAISFELIANNADIIFLDSASDPFTDAEPSIANHTSTLADEAHTEITARIGSANFDIGHIFATVGGGIAGLGVVCSESRKGYGMTGRGNPTGDAFDVDYVAHEIGHQFSGNHTYNGTVCNTGNASTAYEPGSGSTIQAYAGICGSDNLQGNSDPIFSAVSFDEMVAYVEDGTGASCGATSTIINPSTAATNTAPSVDAGRDYTVPNNTPLVLSGSATDSDGDALTYLWEQRDLGPKVPLGTADNGSSPLFRVWTPTTEGVRYLPKLSTVVAGIPDDAEMLPNLAREMDFRLTARDGNGGISSDDVVVNVVSTDSRFPSFSLMEPSQGQESLGSTATVRWNVAETNASPIGATNIDVYLSTDSGATFTASPIASVPNTGYARISFPGGINTTTARLVIMGQDNIFYDVSNADFSLNSDAEPTPEVPAPTVVSLLPTAGGAELSFIEATLANGNPVGIYQSICRPDFGTVSESTSPGSAIIDQQTTTSTIAVSSRGSLSNAGITLDLDISHTYRGDLRISVTSPGGTTVSIETSPPGNADDVKIENLAIYDFAGEVASGDWTLTVSDTADGDQGTLNSWSISGSVIVGNSITSNRDASPIYFTGMEADWPYSCEITAFDNTVTPMRGGRTVAAGAVTPTASTGGSDSAEAFIERFYVNILGRPSDEGGLNAWLDVIQTQSASAVVLGFLNSPEFLAKNLDDAAFVDILYRTLFDREGDTGGVEYWLSELASGRLRDMVIWGFLRAAEFKTLSDSFGVTALNAADESAYGIRAFVERFYTLVLGRQPDRGGFDTWVTALTNGTYAGGDIARAFFLSPEYLGQNTTNEVFVETAYRAFFGREADPAGKEGWLDVLAQGQSREYVLNGFIGSAEFAALAASYGINPISTPTTTYTVTASASTGGSINPSGTQTVAEGGTVSFTLAADSGYSFSTISGTCPSGQVLGADYTTGSITGDCTVVAEFTANTTSGYCAGTPTGVICDPNSDGRRDPGGTMDSWSGGDWGFENTPIPNGKVVAYPFLANAGAAGLEGFMEFSNNMPDLWNTGYQWKGWFSESPGGAVLNNNDSYCRKYSPNPNPNEIRWSQAATPNRFSCNLGQAERVLYFNMAVDCYEELSIGCTVGVPFPGIGGYEAYYIKVYPRGWRRTQKAGDAEAIPTLPMLALFIFSGLLGLFGTRRLASR